MKGITVALIGRPSSGKSTLLNTICNNKVSIVSPSPQTTLKKIRGIYRDDRGFIEFIDTPGLHNDTHAFNKMLQKVSRSSLSEADCVLYVLDLSREPKTEEEEICKFLSKCNVPIIILFNKKDLYKNEDDIKRQVSDFLDLFARTELKIGEMFYVSALLDNGIDDLLISIFKKSYEKPEPVLQEEWTDQNLEDRVSEIIRESAINTVYDEIPHSIYVDLIDLKFDGEKVTVVATIFCEKESQKGIIVGKGGANIKKIRISSFKKLKKIFYQSKLEVNLTVKCSPDWKKNEKIIKKLIS